MKVFESDNLLFIRMEDGEDLFENLKNIVSREKFSGTILSTLGQLKQVELAYYQKEKKRYVTKTFEGPFEITSLSGNISWDGDEPVFHIHAVLGTSDFNSISGHLKSAKVNATLEMFILKTPFKLIRVKDEATGLKLLEGKNE